MYPHFKWPGIQPEDPLKLLTLPTFQPFESINGYSPRVCLRLVAASDRVARDDELQVGVGLRVAEERDDLRLAHPVHADTAHL